MSRVRTKGIALKHQMADGSQTLLAKELGGARNQPSSPSDDTGVRPLTTNNSLSIQRASSKRRSVGKPTGERNLLHLHHQILPVVIAPKNDPMPARDREGERGESLDLWRVVASCGGNNPQGLE